MPIASFAAKITSFAADMPFEEWSQGFVQFAGLVSPWLELVDDCRFLFHPVPF